MWLAANQVRMLLSLELCEIFRAAPSKLASKMNILPNHQLRIQNILVYVNKFSGDGNDIFFLTFKYLQ